MNCFSFKCFPPKHKYCCEGEVSKGHEDEPLYGLAYDTNIHDEEGPHIYVSCNLHAEHLLKHSSVLTQIGLLHNF